MITASFNCGSQLCDRTITFFGTDIAILRTLPNQVNHIFFQKISLRRNSPWIMCTHLLSSLGIVIWPRDVRVALPEKNSWLILLRCGLESRKWIFPWRTICMAQAKLSWWMRKTRRVHVYVKRNDGGSSQVPYGVHTEPGKEIVEYGT